MGTKKTRQWKSGDSSCHGHIPGLLEDEGEGKEDNPVYGADSGDDDLDDFDFKGISCELGMVEGQICSIPFELFDLPDLREILSLDTWNSCLTEEDRFSLSAYLPDMDEWTFWLTMKELFSGCDMYFGNPMDTFFKRLKGGFYPPKIYGLREFLQFLERRKHYHALRSYHDKMTQMFKDMRSLWDECDMNAGVEERLYMWRTRRNCRDANLLDLNAVPSDGYLLNEDVNSDAIVCHLPKRMKTWETVRAKNMVASPSANGMNIIAPNCSTKGVLKVKTSGNVIHNHNQKMVVGELSEQRRSVPKGLLKVVPKVPSVLPQLSKVFSRRSQTALLVGARDLQDHKPAPTYLGNAGGIAGSSFLWQKFAGTKLSLEQSECTLNRLDSALINSRYLQNSSENRGKEVDIADLGKHKWFEHDETLIGSKRYKFGGQNLWQNFDTGKRGLFERSLESYPYTDQHHEGERQSRIFQKECITILPRVSEAVSRDLGIAGGMQEKLMVFPNQMKTPSDFNVENSVKPSTLPLTYKRRKSQSKNSSGFTNSLITSIDIRSGSPKESNQTLGDSVKALKIKFMSWENPPLNRDS